MRITVIVCTCNRSKKLRKALESVARSTVPGFLQWEVLVVDNNSNDETCSVVEDFIRRFPSRFRYLHEPKPGKSHALNAGIAESSGDVLAFMDDDVVVEATWLKNLSAPLCSGPWAGVGGRILTPWEGPLPNWLPTKERYGLAPLALFDLGGEAGPLHESPFGTNMAFHRRMFEEYSGFRTDLGPRPGDEIKNEDVEFGLRLLNGGERLWYEPSAVVYHPVWEERLRKGYFLRWWFDKARADARQSGIPAGTEWFVAGVPMYLSRRLAVWAVRWLFAVRPADRFSAKLKVWSTLGWIQECYRLAHEASATARKTTRSD